LRQDERGDGGARDEDTSTTGTSGRASHNNVCHSLVLVWSTTRGGTEEARRTLTIVARLPASGSTPVTYDLAGVDVHAMVRRLLA